MTTTLALQQTETHVGVDSNTSILQFVSGRSAKNLISGGRLKRKLLSRTSLHAMNITLPKLNSLAKQDYVELKNWIELVVAGRIYDNSFYTQATQAQYQQAVMDEIIARMESRNRMFFEL